MTELQQKWIDALEGRSEKKYTQGRGCLFDGDSFCCLGVLADILGYSWEKTENSPYDYIGTDSDGIKCSLYVTTKDEVAAGITDQGSLAKLNDRGVTFAEIAVKLKEIFNKESKDGDLKQEQSTV